MTKFEQITSHPRTLAKAIEDINNCNENSDCNNCTFYIPDDCGTMDIEQSLNSEVEE